MVFIGNYLSVWFMLALIIFSIISSSLFLQAPAVAENINGNQRFESFNQVKKILEKDIEQKIKELQYE